MGGVKIGKCVCFVFIRVDSIFCLFVLGYWLMSFVLRIYFVIFIIYEFMVKIIYVVMKWKIICYMC